MSNDNGLISSLDLSATGAVDSNFFLRKGQPITVPSPLEIISPDGTKTTTISVSNSGSTVIDSELDLRFENNDGNVFFTAPDGTIFAVAVSNGGDTNFQTSGTAQLNITSDGVTTIAPITQASGNGALRIQNGADCPVPVNFVTWVGGNSITGLTVGNLQTYGYTSVGGRICLDLDANGSEVIVGDVATVGGAVLNVNGTLGLSRVFDTLYNPPPTPHVNIVTTLFSTGVSIPTTGFVSPTFTLTPGVYQLNCEYTAFNSLDYAIPANGTIATKMFLIGPPGFNPRADAIYFTTAMVPSLAGAPTGFPAEANFQSGFIIIPVIGANTFAISVDTNEEAYNFGGTALNTGLNFTIIKFSS